MRTREPAPRPCVSCPYRRDVPPGLWAAHEYEKLPDYDKEMVMQPQAVFGCHQQNGRLCAGWVACHLPHLLSLRILTRGSRPDLHHVEHYTTDVPVFASGLEAALHGLSGVENPGPEAIKMIERLERKQRRRLTPHRRDADDVRRDARGEL